MHKINYVQIFGYGSFENDISYWNKLLGTLFKWRRIGLELHRRFSVLIY